MTTQIRMPAFSATMESAKLLSWLVNEGDTVEKGQVLAEIETDKAVAELESPVNGSVTRIHVPVGDDDIDVEALLIEIDDGSVNNAEATSAATDDTGKETSVPPMREDLDRQMLDKQAPIKTQRIPASPSARHAAQKAGIKLEDVPGTGPNGRVTRQDVLNHANLAEADKVENITETATKLSSLRAAIARAMVASKNTVPHFYTETDIVVDHLIDLQARFSDNTQNIRVTLTALLISAVARALNEVDAAKFRWDEGGVIHKESCDIGIAVDIGEGVVVPVIRDADKLEPLQIAARLKELVSEARSGSLKQSDLGDASLTISNLGMMAIDRFYPIVNMPEPIIVGVGRSREAMVIVDGKPVVRNVMTITLSVDHRVIDGAIAGKFAGALQHIIEGDQP